MVNIENRLKFLAEKYNVFLDDEVDGLVDGIIKNGHEVTKVTTSNSNMVGVDNEIIYGLLDSVVSKTTIYNGSETISYKKKVHIHEGIFSAMVVADPTKNKIYLQWMLSVFTKLIKSGKNSDAIRFGAEDLPQANMYLKLFDTNKRKRLFNELCTSNFTLKNISDPTNINQYEDLSQLFVAVDPFIERDLSGFERNMQRFVDAGQALIPVRDRNFTLYIPLTRDASVLFDSVASWCTAKPNNGMFDNYTNRKTPSGDKSKIYIIIDNKFLNGEFVEDDIPNNLMCQIHFESNQLRDRSNGPNINIYNDIISKSEVLGDFFYEELSPHASEFVGSTNDNPYIKYLISFGFTNILFDLLDKDQPTIRFKQVDIPKLPDLSRFRKTKFIFLAELGLCELTPSMFTLPELEVLSVPNNRLTSIPKEIGKCKNLVYINLLGNNINDISDEICYLDSSMGGNLYGVSVKKDEIGDENYNKLKKLLPNVKFKNNID